MIPVDSEINLESVSTGIRIPYSKHRLTGTKLYYAWANMIQRCCNDKREEFRLYGGRGIKVCDEWKNSSKSFIDWAISNGYKQGLSLERINNDKGYFPENCKWIEFSDQGKNTRRVHYLTIFGDTKSVTDWSFDSRCKVSRRLIHRRLGRNWNPEKAITMEAK